MNRLEALERRVEGGLTLKLRAIEVVQVGEVDACPMAEREHRAKRPASVSLRPVSQGEQDAIRPAIRTLQRLELRHGLRS